MAEKSIQFTMNPHFAKEFARRKVLWQPRHLVDKNVRDKALVEFGHILGYNLDPKAIIRKMLLLCFRFQRAYKQKILNLITECYKTGVPMHEALTISKAPKWMAEVDKELQILPAFIQQINTQTETGNPEPGPSASHYNVKFRVLPGDEATTSNVHKESISGLEPEGEDNKSGKEDDSGTEAVENRCLVENISKQMESNGLPMSEFVKAVVKKAHLMQTTSGQNIMKALARRMNTSTNTLCNIWTRITAISMWKLRTLLKAGDISGKVDSFIAMTYDDWLVTDVILMYGQPGNLITSTNLSSRHLLRPLVTLFHLVQTYHIEEKCSLQTLKLRWQALTRQYNAGETSASSVLLQRRWYELKRAAGRQLRARWRQGDRGPAPHPLYTVIARRYTHVVIEPMAVWWHMVGVSAVFHFEDDITKMNMESVVNEKEDSDDDVILIEKQIETIDVWSDHEEEENRLVIDETMAVADKQESDFREQRNELREHNMEVDAQNVVPSNVAKVSYLSRQNIDLLQHSLDVDIQVSDSYIHNKPNLVQSPSQAKTHDTIQRIDKNVDIEIGNINIENRDTDKGNDNSIKDTAGHQKNVDSPNCGTMSKQVPDSNEDSSTIHTEENNKSTNLNNSNTDKQSNQSSILNTKECVGDIDKLNETDNVLKEISDLSKESSPMDVQEDTVEKTNLSQQSPNIDFPLNIQTNSNTQNINEAKTTDQETMRALNNQDLNKQSNSNVANVADREKQNNKSNDTNKDLESRNDNRDNNKDQQQSNKAKSSKTTLVGKQTELQNKNSTNPESSHLIKTYTESLNDYANINKEIRKYTVKKPQSAKKILIMSPNEINSKFDGMDSNITEKNSENVKSRGLLLKLLTKPHRKLNEMNTGYYQFTHEAAANKIPKDTTKTVEKNDNAVEKSETLQILDELDPNKAETTLIFDSDSDEDILVKDKQDDANTNNAQCKNSKYTSDVLMNEVLDNLRSESVDNLSINNLVETQTGRNDTRSSNSSTFVELLSRNRQTGSNHRDGGINDASKLTKSSTSETDRRIDGKLLMSVEIPLIRIDKTPSWKKYSKNYSIDLRLVNNDWGVRRLSYVLSKGLIKTVGPVEEMMKYCREVRVHVARLRGRVGHAGPGRRVRLPDLAALRRRRPPTAHVAPRPHTHTDGDTDPHCEYTHTRGPGGACGCPTSPPCAAAARPPRTSRPARTHTRTATPTPTVIHTHAGPGRRVRLPDLAALRRRRPPTAHVAPRPHTHTDGDTDPHCEYTHTRGPGGACGCPTSPPCAAAARPPRTSRPARTHTRTATPTPTVIHTHAGPGRRVRLPDLAALRRRRPPTAHVAPRPHTHTDGDTDPHCDDDMDNIPTEEQLTDLLRNLTNKGVAESASAWRRQRNDQPQPQLRNHHKLPHLQLTCTCHICYSFKKQHFLREQTELQKEIEVLLDTLPKTALNESKKPVSEIDQDPDYSVKTTKQKKKKQQNVTRTISKPSDDDYQEWIRQKNIHQRFFKLPSMDLQKKTQKDIPTENTQLGAVVTVAEIANSNMATQEASTGNVNTLESVIAPSNVNEKIDIEPAETQPTLKSLTGNKNIIIFDENFRQKMVKSLNDMAKNKTNPENNLPQSTDPTVFRIRAGNTFVNINHESFKKVVEDIIGGQSVGNIIDDQSVEQSPGNSGEQMRSQNIKEIIEQIIGGQCLGQIIDDQIIEQITNKVKENEYVDAQNVEQSTDRQSDGVTENSNVNQNIVENVKIESIGQIVNEETINSERVDQDIGPNFKQVNSKIVYENEENINGHLAGRNIEFEIPLIDLGPPEIKVEQPAESVAQDEILDTDTMIREDLQETIDNNDTNENVTQLPADDSMSIVISNVVSLANNKVDDVVSESSELIKQCRGTKRHRSGIDPISIKRKFTNLDDGIVDSSSNDETTIGGKKYNTNFKVTRNKLRSLEINSGAIGSVQVSENIGLTIQVALDSNRNEPSSGPSSNIHDHDTSSGSREITDLTLSDTDSSSDPSWHIPEKKKKKAKKRVKKPHSDVEIDDIMLVPPLPIAQYLLEREAELQSLLILCIDLSKPIWRLFQDQLVVTDYMIPFDEPSYWSTGPAGKTAKLILPNTQPKSNQMGQSENQMDQNGDQMGQSRNQTNLIGNQMSQNGNQTSQNRSRLEDVVVVSGRDSNVSTNVFTNTDGTTVLLHAPDEVCIQNNIYKRIYDNPLVYARVKYVVSDINICSILETKQIPIELYSLRTGVISPTCKEAYPKKIPNTPNTIKKTVKKPGGNNTPTPSSTNQVTGNQLPVSSSTVLPVHKEPPAIDKSSDAMTMAVQATISKTVLPPSKQVRVYSAPTHTMRAVPSNNVQNPLVTVASNHSMFQPSSFTQSSILTNYITVNPTEPPIRSFIPANYIPPNNPETTTLSDTFSNLPANHVLVRNSEIRYSPAPWSKSSSLLRTMGNETNKTPSNNVDSQPKISVKSFAKEITYSPSANSLPAAASPYVQPKLIITPTVPLTNESKPSEGEEEYKYIMIV
ncbi:uncharacterized protein LOC131855250 [Achroia grisella]|uniref:uncharacterized protein LOC131855250 n=1 Tax=Achroia grisella TaxID=688607 RepID=UPI0027D20113|nr:uncharacterized protein LOC131855250 [Achroia grisella]